MEKRSFWSKMRGWMKRHPIWTAVIVIVFIIISLLGQREQSTQTEKVVGEAETGGEEAKVETKEISEEVTFSKSINDPAEDCISVQSGKSIICDKGVDIIAANIEQKNGIATIDIELAGDIPSSKNELKIGELGAETYQYQVWIEMNGKWSSVLFGDVTDTLGVSGGCGVSAISCDDSQVTFSINGKKAKIIGPLKSEIAKFKIKTLYQSASLDKDDISDEAEIQ